ncbi:MAG: ABC-2 family transporter protein [Candidatus Abawacabacteria bacterium]|nr:ABC-2 family transporter protein [Candidatus Abawacabacteria bacterium]
MNSLTAVIKLSFTRDMIYRANFWSSVLSRLGFLLVNLAWFGIMYTSLLHVKNWGYAESMFFLATFQLIETITIGFFGNSFANWYQHINSGSLDVILSKPIDPQLVLSLHAISFPQLLTILAPATFILYLAITFPIFTSLFSIAGYMLGILLAVSIFYNLWLIIMTFLFWLVGISYWHQLFRSITSFLQVPPIVYEGFLKFLFYFIIPVFAAVMLPLAIVWDNSVWALCLLLAMATLTTVLARAFFHYGLKAYNSASS